MNYVEILVSKYQSRGLLLDSNLLLLYLVGRIDTILVGTGRYNKLSDFRAIEVVTLERLVSSFRRLVTTAHVMTEVSNLVNTMRDADRVRTFRRFVETLEVISEQEVSSYEVAGRSEFSLLGLTDSVLAHFAGQFLIVSKDGRMVNGLRANKIEALKWVEVLGLTG